MTDQEAELIYDEMTKIFGWIPHPERQPKQFLYYVRLYNYSMAFWNTFFPGYYVCVNGGI